MGNTTLNLVHDVLAQHDLISFRHRLTQQSSFRSAKQGLVAQAIVDSLYEIDQENLLVVLVARCPKTGNPISEQLESVRIEPIKKKIEPKLRETPRAKKKKKKSQYASPFDKRHSVTHRS